MRHSCAFIVDFRFAALGVSLAIVFAAGQATRAAVAAASESHAAPIALDGQHLNVTRVIAVARGGAPVRLRIPAIERVQRSFALLIEAAKEDKPIYGLTRGVGENKDKTIIKGGVIDAETRQLSERFNANLMRVQATATGPPASTEVVRAAMVIRLNTMLLGHTGAEFVVVRAIEDFLNHGITPVVPSRGTVGEADIDVLAHVGLALMGEGDARYAGRVMPAAEALRRAGLKAIVPFAKDALSIFSSNAYSAALAVLATGDAAHMLDRARLVFDVSLEGLNGNVAPFLARVQDIRHFPKQAAVAGAIRRDLAGSYVWSLPTALAQRALQDPLSYRTFSHVLGGALDALSHVSSELRIQINRSDDNPTVLLDVRPPAGATPQERAYYVDGNGLHGAVVPTSNFEPLPWVMELESLSVALAHVSGTSVQRTLRLSMPEFTHLSRFLTANADSIGFAAIQKIPADLDAENRDLANPVSLDAIPVAGDIEDTATNAAAAAARVARVVGNLYTILGVELMHAAQAVDLRLIADPAVALGRFSGPFRNAYRVVVPFLDKDRFLSPDVSGSARFLRGSGA
jgi:histidine ammonia-lyase